MKFAKNGLLSLGIRETVAPPKGVEVFLTRNKSVNHGNPRGEGVLPINGLMGMCRWMGSHFHDWIDYNGVAFSTKFLTDLIAGVANCRDFGKKNAG